MSLRMKVLSVSNNELARLSFSPLLPLSIRGILGCRSFPLSLPFPFFYRGASELRVPDREGAETNRTMPFGTRSSSFYFPFKPFFYWLRRLLGKGVPAGISVICLSPSLFC